MTASTGTTDRAEGPEPVDDERAPHGADVHRERHTRRVEPSPPPTFRTTSSTRFRRSLERLADPS